MRFWPWKKKSNEVLRDKPNTYAEKETERFLAMIENSGARVCVILYAETFNHDTNLKFPIMKDAGFRQNISRIMKEKYPNNDWYFSRPDEYDSWTFVFYLRPKKKQS